MVRAEAAYDALGRGSDADALAIARAILAERRRCAAVAKQMLTFADTTSRADEEIYLAIMEPTP